MAAHDVYASKGGRRYHSHQYCPAFRAGQELWDCADWVPGMPLAYLTGGYGLGLIDISEAAERGLSRCARCRPVRTTVEPGRFGHVPFQYDGVDICMRCWTVSGPYSAHSRDVVPYPCTTAVLLGLADPT